MAYLSAENLSQSFETVKINVSFECDEGTLTSIVGPSGSGKSTVLRLLAGLNEGEGNHKIVLGNEDITFFPPAKRHIGMVFQKHTLFDHLTVEDNVAYGLVSSGIKKKEARKQASEFLTQFNLEGFEKRYPETLSGGEAQRVCLARTLIMKPKLVLFDEPLSALDAPLRKKLAALIRNLQKKIGFTAIMVTHDINEAKEISDKILMMKNGSLIWQGRAEDFSETIMELEGDKIIKLSYSRL